MKHIVVVIFLTLVLLSSADCKPRPTVSTDEYSCFADPTTDQGCGGAICYCCYDDGCWICGIKPGEKCVWDPSYRSQQGTLTQTEPPSISPESGQRPIKQPPTLIQTEPISISPEGGKPPSETVQAGPTVINFDDLVTGGLGTGGPIPVTNQYASQGVTFNSPVAIDFSKGTAIPGFAHSGTIAIEQCYVAEFCTSPIEIRFSQGQSRVKVWVGYDSTIQEKTPVIMRAFDSSGNQIARAEENLAEQGPIPINIPLEVSTINQRNPVLTRSNIVRVTVDFRDENRYTNGLAVDDVEFERVEGILPEKLPELVRDSGEGQQYAGGQVQEQAGDQGQQGQMMGEDLGWQFVEDQGEEQGQEPGQGPEQPTDEGQGLAQG